MTGPIQTVDIPFNTWSEAQLEQGEKTATTRTSKQGNPGDRFDAIGNTYELTHVVKLPLKIVANWFYDQEGAENPAEFREVWADIHYQRGFEPDWRVWLHLFREVC